MDEGQAPRQSNQTRDQPEDSGIAEIRAQRDAIRQKLAETESILAEAVNKSTEYAQEVLAKKAAQQEAEEAKEKVKLLEQQVAATEEAKNAERGSQ